MTPNDVRLGRDLGQQVSDYAKELGVELKINAAELGEYIADRISHLRFASKEPGYAEGLAAEKDNVLLYATGQTVALADSADAKVADFLITGFVRLVAAV